MARTSITVTEFNDNAYTADAGGTAVGATDDGAVSGYRLEDIVLRVEVPADTTATIVAGDSPPALSAGQGNYARSISSGSTEWIGPFESARFAQSDGALHIDVSGTCTVSAFHLPTRF